jgi:hypothetical protein
VSRYSHGQDQVTLHTPWGVLRHDPVTEAQIRAAQVNVCAAVLEMDLGSEDPVLAARELIEMLGLRQ